MYATHKYYWGHQTEKNDPGGRVAGMGRQKKCIQSCGGNTCGKETT